MEQIRLRRSVLFMPGSNPRALEKARNLPCDVVALDLEDSVAPQAKVAAREAVCAALKSFGQREVVVRINALSSPWGKDDLAAMRDAKPDAILIPKVGGPEDIVAACAGHPPPHAQSALAGEEAVAPFRCEGRRGKIEIWAMIETCRAVLNLSSIAAAGAAVMVLGANDLLKDMRATPMPARENLWAAMTDMVIAGRARGLELIDGTFNAIADAPGLAAECAQGKAFGFDGKTLIHPAQIETANRIFAPGADEIAAARRILAAFEQPENRGKGAIALDGEMVERLHAERAAHILAAAASIAARSA